MNAAIKVRSLRLQLLIPLLLASIIVGAGGAYLLEQSFSSALNASMHKQIDVMADSMNLAAESASDLIQLQRYVSTLGAQRGVKQIIIAAVESKQVIVSNKHSIIDTELDDVALPEAIRNYSSLTTEQLIYDSATGDFWLERGIRLINLGQVSTLGNCLLIIQVDASPMVKELKLAQVVLVGWIMVLISALSGVSLYVVQNGVLRRTAAIARTLQDRKSGDRDARVNIEYLDELGVLAESLNAMLDQQDRFDQVLSKSNEALGKSEERYRLIVETAQEGIWLMDDNNLIIYANNRLVEMLETSIDNVVGRLFTDFIPDHLCQFALARVENAVNTELDRYDVVLKTAVGNEVRVTCSSCALYDESQRYKGLLAMIIDISERVNAEKKLKDNQQKLQEIFAHSTDTIFIVQVTKDGNFVYEDVNMAFEQGSGISTEYAVGKSPDELFAPEASTLFLADFRECVEKREPLEIEQSFNLTGSVMHLNSLLVPVLNDSGEVYRIYGFARDVTDRRAAEERALYLAQHDTLTGLPNRTLLRDRLDQALLRAEIDNTYVAMLFLDLDRFKAINDSFGHPIGDAFLKEVAQRLLRCIRNVDTVSRQGGDEFLLVLADFNSIDDVSVIAKNILNSLDEPFEVDGFTVATSFSIGISIYPDDTKTATGLLRNADTALMHAKQSGRNTYRFFTEAMNVNAIERLQLETQLRKASLKDEFSLHYQPQIELTSGAIIGAEALIRWTHPSKGNIPPNRFIPVAEDCGLIIQIGEWVLNEAVRQNMEWQRKGFVPISIAVNLSAVQFKRDDLVSRVYEVLIRHGMAPELLELELTESILLEDVEHTLGTVLKLKDLGVQLSIDDFGTGYSSLSYLKRFAVDKLKVDQSFVRDLATDPDDAAIVHAIIQLGRSLQLKIIAEGVETQGQLDYLINEGCDEVQGYFFFRPVPAESFEDTLRDGISASRRAI